MMKRILSVLLCVLMLLALCGCARSKRADVNSTYRESAYSFDEGDYGVYTEEAVISAAGLSLNDTALKAAPSLAETTATADTQEDYQEKIIYSADVTVESTEFDRSVEQINALVEQYGAWIESSSVYGQNYSDSARGNKSYRTASFTLRVPSESFQEVMSTLSTVGNVPYTRIYTENVTAEYHDMQARLLTYQTQETRLLEMMKTAETVEDIILLEDRLTELRYEIERMQSRLLNWDRRVSYSTISLELREVQAYTPETPVTITFGERLARAFRYGLESVAEFFEDLLLWLVESLPALVLLAALVFVLVRIIKALRKRAKKKKMEKITAADSNLPKP